MTSNSSSLQFPSPYTPTKRRKNVVDSDIAVGVNSASKRRRENSSPLTQHHSQDTQINPYDTTQDLPACQSQLEDEQFAQPRTQLGPPTSSQYLDSQFLQSPEGQRVSYSTPSTDLDVPALPVKPLWTAPSPPASIRSDTHTSSSFHTADLHKLAEQLKPSRITPKPESNGQPEVWADTRMELCETLHYYRSYHGGCYATGGFARAFMFADSSHPRDYMDASVIISRAGGGLAKDKETGAMSMGRDQTEGPVVQSLRNSIAQLNPVVIITADNNPYAPSKPPHPYCVMDYFKPINIWWEKTKGKKFMRFRFEKLNSKQKSWWQPKGVPEVAVPGSLDPPITQCCSICSVQSCQVYLQCWMCLQPNCSGFWKVPTEGGTLQEPEENSLVYDPRFLKQHTPWPNDNHVYPLASVDVQLSGQSIAGEDCLRAHWSGVVCPLCGRCNSRLSWTGWKCASPGCSFEKRPPHTLIPAASLHDAFNPVSAAYTPSRDTHLPAVKLSVSFAHNYRINRFEIPGVEGFITHMIANKTVIEEAGGPNVMYEELQRVDIGLARRPMGHDHFTRHYAVNYGMPYKFIAATASNSFTGSARPITETRSRLNWAAKYLLSQETGMSIEDVGKKWKEKEFNEVLALGYFEQQKISYHDDGETGIGPTIATLSLGDTGTMRIRMKAKHFNGVSKASVYNTSPPLSGSAQFERRSEIHPTLLALHQTDKKAYNQRLKDLPKELGLKNGGTARDAVTMVLQHGDVVIMHGAELQKYYEHSVDHAGKLRFALTCRYIDSETLGHGDKPTYGVAPDDGDYDGARLPLPGS
ncbi:hypothetical protein P280DRAFT_409756 [Massarina eburnea CBS 473.64]|uniref:Alpha-ketoglutarate-dependent dioxygenase AlkB-like domain-containing protein n=1 Tax=Massarina eburnea CBS 473.64 TaxID=1395130 RepID=A0A6A6RQL8_9PLEO|nr:hypothetical protein P280DRAFT_409756 [Massarina eburnea CBS 473.64]